MDRLTETKCGRAHEKEREKYDRKKHRVSRFIAGA